MEKQILSTGHRILSKNDGVTKAYVDAQDQEIKDQLQFESENRSEADANLQNQVNDLNTIVNGKQDVLMPGSNIDITGNVISATGIPTKTSELENDSGFITGILVGDGIYYTSDGKLTTVEPEGNFIDITNEWIFMNGFRLQYNGSTPGEGNDMRILYSPVSDVVKFTSECRINRTSPLINNWNRILRYTGDRFYTTYNAPNVDLAPVVGLTGALGGIAYTIATAANGSSQPGLLRIAYVGSPTVSIDETGIGINPFLSSGSTTFYGCILQNLVLKVHKKV